MNPDQLKKMLALAERTETLAARKMAEARTAAEACRRQLDDLAAYRARPAHAAGARVSAVHFAQAGRFYGRVDEALALQSARLKDFERAIVAREAEWIAARGERRALEALLETALAGEAADSARREQKQLDEAAAQTWLRNG